MASSANFPVDKVANVDITNKGEKKNDIKDVDYTDYKEGIYVGYRYFDCFNRNVSYPFGYGLSFTTFKYNAPTINVENGVYTVTVNVENTGKMAGKEVVQLYVSAPQAKEHNKPEKELKAFAKTKELKPGESAVVTLKINTADLASFDETTSSWVVDAGSYNFLIGASSRDIKAALNTEVAAYTIKANDILKPQGNINELKR